MRPEADILLASLNRLLRHLSEQALQLDPDAAKHFGALAGQVIEVHCLEPDLTWHLVLSRNHIECIHGASPTPNVVITGKPKSLLQTLLTGSADGSIAIEGDATLLVQLQTLTKNFSPDLVTPLENIVGHAKAQRTAALLELGASTLGDLFSAAANHAQNTAQTLLAERYSTTTEVDDFLTRVDQLRLRVDRFQANLARHTDSGNTS